MTRPAGAPAVRLTHVGGPTVLIEAAGRRLLTDPTFDPAGGSYGFGWGSRSRKTGTPALTPDDVGPLDAVLLSHDGHADNLDAAGRALLDDVPLVITTVAGAKRLGSGRPGSGRPGPRAVGLAAGGSTVLRRDGLADLRVTATPGRHGPPLSLPVAGPVVGFRLDLDGYDRTLLWMTGDTVLTAAVRALATELEVDIALVHLGGVRFPTTGRLRYSMTGADAVALLGLLSPTVAVPVHYEGWSHFREPAEAARAAFDAAPAGVRDAVRWLAPGIATPV